MPSLAVLRTLLREIATGSGVPRVTEPDLVMDDPSKVAAYVEAGRTDGVMAPVYLFHCAQACEVMRPGDIVVDLACGPANQLAMIAALNPGVRFIGVDMSEPMLARAKEHVVRQGLTNVEFQRGDICNLAHMAIHSVDAVISTMALHHLPTLEHLKAAFAGIARILKPGGGVYLVDFGRLKSPRSIEYFAYQYADRQPELFTIDYLNSLRAAFSKQDFQAAGAGLGAAVKMYSTFICPYMVAFKSAAGGAPDPQVRQRLAKLRKALPRHHRTDLGDLLTFFALGGMRSAYLR